MKKYFLITILVFIIYNNLLQLVRGYSKFDGDECELYDGRLGICTAFEKCEWAINGIKGKKVSYSDVASRRCSFNDLTEIICCWFANATDNFLTSLQNISKDSIKIDNNEDRILFPDKNYEYINIDDDNNNTNNNNNSKNNSNGNNIPSRLGRRKIEAACSNYTVENAQNIVLGYNIIGGKQVLNGEFPHMASIGYESQDIGKEYDFRCGGTIINENYVLTAAHCISDRSVPLIVRMGKIDLYSNDNDGVDREIAGIIPHPLYQRSRRYHDLALLRLKESIDFNEFIHPACINTNLSDIDTNVELYVTGWGRISIEHNTQSNVLLKTNVTSVPLQSCNQSVVNYGRDRRIPNGIEMSQICAYDPMAKNDACEGDSGGPLQILIGNGMSTIVGVTSFGISCGSSLPAIYTRVAYYTEWIEEIAWSN